MHLLLEYEISFTLWAQVLYMSLNLKPFFFSWVPKEIDLITQKLMFNDFSCNGVDLNNLTNRCTRAHFVYLSSPNWARQRLSISIKERMKKTSAQFVCGCLDVCERTFISAAFTTADHVIHTFDLEQDLRQISFLMQREQLGLRVREPIMVFKPANFRLQACFRHFQSTGSSHQCMLTLQFCCWQTLHI